MVQAIPAGFHTLTPDVIVNDAAAAIEFYQRAFGAEEISRMPAPGGQKVLHAEVRIGDSVLMLSDEMPEMGDGKSATTLGGTPVFLHLYVEDADAVFKRALDAGATAMMPIDDAPWGDRYGQLQDPFGLAWSVATHKEDLSEDEIARRFAEFAPSS